MSLLRLDRVSREFGSLVILDEVSGAVALGERIGLVGPNGAGKTTLLRIAAGLDEPDRGAVSRKRGLSLGLLAQESHFDAAFMAASDLRLAVRTGAAHLDVLAARLAELERDHRVTESAYADLQHRFEVHGGYTLDQRVEATLSGLGFARDEWSKPPAALSGGEQTRAALARLVIADPDVLLLDEPTNHLDLDALEWLEDHLRRRAGALVVASHDRAFLDATVGRIWELRDRHLTVFRGDYSQYHRQREERDARLDKDVDIQADSIARERELVQRYRSHRKFSKMHEHEARLERLQVERIEAPKATKRLKLATRSLTGAGPARSGEVVVRAEDLVIGYLPRLRREEAPGPIAPGSPQAVARIPFLAAQRGERIGIVGPNGAGKTTLLRTIAGELPPIDGVLTLGGGASIGYLAQLRGAAIPGTTVLDALLEAMPITAGEARGYLARFLFRGDDALKEVRALSGGERSRLELALLGIMPANLLLLDEPTNHLDIPAREAIESFMRETPATLLVVSHDRRMLETVCDRLWVVDGGAAAAFEGGYRAWRAAVADGWTVAGAIQADAKRLRTGGRPVAGTVVAAASARTASARSASAAPTGDSADDRRTRRAATVVADRPSPTSDGSAGPGVRRARGSKLSKEAYRRQRTALDSELTRLGLRKNHLELAMGDPAVAANFVELRRMSSELADVSVALESAEEAWLELEERAP
ncbi:MAG: ATP-binding cassette, subfamily er 3 [Chloroflexota bacterium]|jgi:ATP-binding cassette subfamily F protein 3|nr:ATP-binding cassette, subfamily er 3 [Chloroflexota bacterium]